MYTSLFTCTLCFMFTCHLCPLYIYIVYLYSLSSEYTHKVEAVTTLTPESPPCMITPTTANIHQLKAMRLVVHKGEQNHWLNSAATESSDSETDYCLPFLMRAILLFGSLNSPFCHHSRSLSLSLSLLTITPSLSIPPSPSAVNL